MFVGEFSMCHDIPLTERLDRDPLTVPREELLLSKLQIVELTENDQRDIYNLCTTTMSASTRTRGSAARSSRPCAPATGGCGAPAS